MCYSPACPHLFIPVCYPFLDRRKRSGQCRRRAEDLFGFLRFFLAFPPLVVASPCHHAAPLPRAARGGRSQRVKVSALPSSRPPSPLPPRHNPFLTGYLSFPPPLPFWFVQFEKG